MNSNYNSLKLEQTYSKSPYHQYQYPFPHEYNQNSNNSESPHNVPGPYGVGFGDQSNYNFNNKKKYREDLDYLVSLKKKRKEEELISRNMEREQVLKSIEGLSNVDQMIRNDKRQYYIDYMKDNNNGGKNKKRGYDELRPSESFIESNLFDTSNNEANIKKKEAWKQTAISETEKFRNLKELENLKKQELNRQSLQDMEYINKQQENRTNQYRDKINGNNEKIYHHAANFNHFIGGKPEPFHIKNDFEFNRLNAINKKVVAYTPKNELENDYFHDKHPLKSPHIGYTTNKNMKYTDNTSKNQMILPGYYYPNMPVALNKTAYDSIDTVKNYETNAIYAAEHNDNLNQKQFGPSNNASFGVGVREDVVNTNNSNTNNNHTCTNNHNSNNFKSNVEHDITAYGIDNKHTLLDTHSRKNYLGNTSLVHNPIIYPIDDVSRNKRIDNHKYRHLFNNRDNILKAVGFNIIS